MSTTSDTPALLLDCQRMDRNIARMRSQLSTLGVPMRAHVKTNKCLEVARGSRFGVDDYRLVWLSSFALMPLLYLPCRALSHYKRRSTLGWVRYF